MARLVERGDGEEEQCLVMDMMAEMVTIVQKHCVSNAVAEGLIFSEVVKWIQERPWQFEQDTVRFSEIASQQIGVDCLMRRRRRTRFRV